MGTGVNNSKPWRDGGSLLEFNHGSCRSKIAYFGLRETKESTAYVLDSPLAQFKERIILDCPNVVLMIVQESGWLWKLQDQAVLLYQTL